MSNETFQEATDRYEKWLTTYFSLDRAGLEKKYKKMRKSPFAFLRGSFYRWPRHFDAVDEDIRRAPTILCTGDVHLENYGTWRDQEGRLAWGVNDFDEATELPFTADLVRLATSARLAAQSNDLKLPADKAVDAILSGYEAFLDSGPAPFVLENRHGWLRDLGSASGDDAASDWKELLHDNEIDSEKIPSEAKDLLLACLPSGASDIHFRTRLAGLGSLGRPRFVATAEWQGGLVAREIKAAAPSAAAKAVGDDDLTAAYRTIEKSAIRSRDPFLQIMPRWVVRRLSPEARKIEMDEVEQAPDQQRLLRAMGKELVNIHLGSAGTAALLKKHIDKLAGGWLRSASAAAAERVLKDYAEFGGK